MEGQHRRAAPGPGGEGTGGGAVLVVDRVRSPGLDLLNEHAGLILVPRDLQAGIGAVTIAVTNTDPVDPASFEIDELDVHVGLLPGTTRRVTIDAAPGTYRFYDFLSGTDLLAAPVRSQLVWLAAPGEHDRGSLTSLFFGSEDRCQPEVLDDAVAGVQRVTTWGGVSMLGRLAAVGLADVGEPMAVVGAVAVIEVG